jgi:hypothetical protein
MALLKDKAESLLLGLAFLRVTLYISLFVHSTSSQLCIKHTVQRWKTLCGINIQDLPMPLC